AAPVLEGGRAHIGELMGLRAEGIAFVESATAALNAVLGAWPLPADATVGVAPSEWGTNLSIFEAHGLATVELATDPDGRIDLDALERVLALRPPSIVHVTQVPAHRGLIQPINDVLSL